MAISEELRQTGQCIAKNAVITKKYFPIHRAVPYGDIIYSEELKTAVGMALRKLSPGIFCIGKTADYPSNLTLTRVR